MIKPDHRIFELLIERFGIDPHSAVYIDDVEANVTAALLAMLRLEGLGDRKVTALSGGQRQRVALGRALAVSPQILLLDEPLSNLDARIREEVRHEIKTLQHALGITTVHVTHDRQEAMVMADRIVILDAGRAAQVGTPEEIYNRPNSSFVASFMGAGNVVPLRVCGAGKGIGELGKCQNIVVKLGGLGMLFGMFDFHTRETPPSSEELARAYQPYIESCIAAFGPDRGMFESNFPPDGVSSSYTVLWNAFKRLAAGYSADEKAKLFSGTAKRVYRLA